MESVPKFPINKEKGKKEASERIFISKKELAKRRLSYFDTLWVRHMCAYKFAVPYIKNKVVLDLGCGSGYGTYYLSIKGAKHIIGIDISKEAIRYCKDQYFNENLQYVTMDGSKLAFKDNSFDCVTSFQVIEHIENLDDYLSELRRVAKMFFVSTPNKKTYDAAGNNLFHVREFYLKDLQDLLQSFFQKVKLFGVYPGAQIQDVGNNVEKLEASIDNLRLRTFVELIPMKIKNVWATHFLKINDAAAFTYQENPSENCLDFIAVCVKRNGSRGTSL